MDEPVNEERQMEHLKDYINYTRERIALLDRKCSIFIGLQTALIAVIAFIVNTVCLPFPALKLTGYMVIAVSSALACVIMLLLLATIRPGKRFFSSSTSLNFMQSRGIMWTSIRKGLSESMFKKRVNSLSKELITEDLQAVAYNHHLLMRTKYRAYIPAAWLLKMQMLVMAIIAILVVLHIAIVAILKMHGLL
jgi:hypothetical protein